MLAIINTLLQQIMCFCVSPWDFVICFETLAMTVHKQLTHYITNSSHVDLLFFIQYAYSSLMEEYPAMINVRRKNNFHIDSAEDLYGENCWLCGKRCRVLRESILLGSVWRSRRFLPDAPLLLPCSQWLCSTARSDAPTAAAVALLTPNMAASGAGALPALPVCSRTPALERSNTPALLLWFTL